MDKQQKSEYNRAYRAANLDRLRARRRERYAQNPEPERQRAREYAAIPERSENRKAANNRYSKAHAEKRRAYSRARYWRKRDEIIAYNKERRSCPIASRAERDWWLRRDFGITLADYERMLEEQSGGCAICRATVSSNGSRLAVDHCHSTGTVRGVLCLSCNHGLGRFKDDPRRLRRAAEYLENAVGRVVHAKRRARCDS